MHTEPLTRHEQKQQTRQKLLDATIEIIANEGFEGVTLAKVAQRTGLSRGICNFHFHTKDQLMIEAFQVLYDEYEHAWKSAIGDESLAPELRLKNLVITLLTPPIADKEKIAVWLAFWGVTPHRRTYINICTAGDCLYEEAIENILYLLSGGENEVNGMNLRTIAVSLTALIDGSCLQYLIASGRFSPDDAIKACFSFLGGFFPQFLNN